MPFERKMDYFEQDFRRPVTKEEIRSKKRNKSYTHTKPRTEPAWSGMKKRKIIVSKNHVDHLEEQIDREVAQMKNESV